LKLWRAVATTDIVRRRDEAHERRPPERAAEARGEKPSEGHMAERGSTGDSG